MEIAKEVMKIKNNNNNKVSRTIPGSIFSDYRVERKQLLN